MEERLLNADYRDMVTCLQSEGVEFMLVGGYAVGRPKDLADAQVLAELLERKDG